MTIFIRNIVKSESAIAYDDGSKCLNLVMDSIEKDGSVVLDFQGINFVITVKSDVDVITSKGYADKILVDLSDDIKSFYDIQVMIVNEDEENQNYPIIGYKHKSKAGFTF